jgi:hypothetical protein
MSKLPILITSSIDPRGMTIAYFTPREREQMYIEALQYYMLQFFHKGYKSNYKIVFVDNSGWDLRLIKSKVSADFRNNVEFISLNPNDFAISRGKSYNEVLLISQAIDKSKFIQESQAFFKVTGRYPILNLAYFLDEASSLILQDLKHLYIDVKNIKMYKKLGLSLSGQMADVRLFGSTNALFKDYLLTYLEELDDYKGRLFEGMVFNFVICQLNHPKLQLRFKEEPLFAGMEGSVINSVTFNRNHLSFFGKTKIVIGNLFRKFFPNVWI